jgi:hypothetical protein
MGTAVAVTEGGVAPQVAGLQEEMVAGEGQRAADGSKRGGRGEGGVCSII